MDDTGFINKKNSCGVVVSKGYSNVLSKFADAYFYMTFVVRVYASKYVAPPPLIIPAKRFNRDVIKGFYIEGSNITTAPQRFTSSTLFLSCNELFANSFPDSVTHLLVLVYDVCCSH